MAWASTGTPASMAKGLREFFETGEYSDLIVKCSNGDELKVHKLVLFSQSPVLRNACDPQKGFKESKEGVIELNHDSPESVKAMLEFLSLGKPPGKT
ncbi:uncharacterized protein K452DRAFT_298523 [Aplosporella prunicola CBS 121167]|uniref:BTB domain-containing protein n=1 Tax=Aplosporella prunicola CBS 121167 TaxID=1176127 RepID=A0A6A6BF36_9PEZI|nr:uncharacterized protein K452DRAFT_298523 [Aplosporella prunicola CBS 121167]KAF2141864.1 hypothetical protein K452DRAFT_298523 [Aplosporella prunicola CBS 121167]